jgi:hypothetical protein
MAAHQDGHPSGAANLRTRSRVLRRRAEKSDRLWTHVRGIESGHDGWLRNTIVCKNRGRPPICHPTNCARDLNTSVVHAWKCTATLPVGNGFIFTLDVPRLCAATRGMRRRCGAASRACGAQHRARERQQQCWSWAKYKADSALVDGFISGFDSPRLSRRWMRLGGRGPQLGWSNAGLAHMHSQT